ncbi:hypothetical protein OpiT1DRAFT_05601 [Opitutaceae bacterium TAV1]|nr:hypothetical protein OpiT1DRAFT_05601 [Opitutaceae bacterium TAV1]
MEKANLNTILLTVMLGVMGWVGYTVQETSKQVSAITERVGFSDREIIELRTRMSQLELDVARVKARLSVD